MRTPGILLATLQLLSLLVAAHPFIIISTKITEVYVRSPSPRPTHMHQQVLPKRQNLLSDIQSQVNSIFGIGDDTSTSTKKGATKSASGVTIPPPATASATPTSTQSSEATSTDNNDEDSSSSTSDSSTTLMPSTTTDSTTTSTPSSTSSATLVSSPTLSSAPATPTAESKSPSSSESGVPPGGIAVAVIMSLLVLALTAWLIFKYHPKSQAWWAAREEKKFRERSYRDALDGPNAGSPSLRQDALGDTTPRRQTLKSFFAPSTAKLGHGKEIRRKPVNWGVESPATPTSSTFKGYEKERKAQIGESDTEKISMTASAAPMGQIERYSYMPQPQAEGQAQTQLQPATSAVSPISPRPKEEIEELPAVSPMSLRSGQSAAAAEERDLHPLPPVPQLPTLSHAKRGSDGVFRLA